MVNVFLANIGNRNIRYQGKFISNYLGENRGSSVECFRSFTKYLFENFEKEKAHISSVIINNLIDKYKHELSVVYFVSTDMEKVEARIDQDTIYEGEILCKLLNEQYPQIIFKNYVIKCRVYNHDRLSFCYRNLFNEIKAIPKFNKIYYCDSGGTSQQKFVSKVLLEYMFDKNKLETWYVKQTELGKSDVVRSEINEYRKIIDFEQIKVLAKNSEYQAAISLGKDILSSHQNNLLKFAFYRFNFAYQDAAKMANQMYRNKKIKMSDNDIFLEAKEQVSNVNHNHFSGFLSEHNFFLLRELLVIAKRHEKLKRFSNAVLTYHQFIELFLNSVIEELGYNVNKPFNINEVHHKFPNIIKGFPNGISNLSVPVKIHMALHTDNDTCRTIIDLIKRTNGYFNYYSTTTGKVNVSYLDSKRNKFAHEGKMVKEKEYFDMPYLKDLELVNKYFDVDEDNHYELLNMIILENL